MSEDKDAEEAAREYLRDFLKWWTGGGTARHVGLGFLTLGIAAPFLLGLIETIVILVWVLPSANTFTEKLAAYGVFFSLLTALAFQLARGSGNMMTGFYLLRRRRRARKPEDPPYDPRVP